MRVKPTAAFRAPSAWLLAAAFLLALGSIAGITMLQDRATSSRDAQLELERVMKEFTALQNVPYDGIGVESTAEQAVIANRLQIGRRRIEATFAALRRDASSPHVNAAMAPYQVNMATLEQIRVAIADGRRSSADPLGLVAGRSQRTVDRELRAASIDYQRRASESVRLATLGSAAMILVLITLFGVFYVRLQKANATAKRLALTDELTGLPNQRSWDQHLVLAMARAGRSGEPLSVLVLDLDSFKQVNDLQGHLAGDRLLRNVSKSWSSALRESDVLGRIGGDEFAVILERTGEAGAREVVARLDRSLAGGQQASTGIAVWDRSEDASGLVTRADMAMYAHKRTVATGEAERSPMRAAAAASQQGR
jgi:diguanylate cyclase (GGDEF)-like protein